MKRLRSVKHLSPKSISPNFKNIESVIDKNQRLEIMRHRELMDERMIQDDIMRRISKEHKRLSFIN